MTGSGRPPLRTRICASWGDQPWVSCIPGRGARLTSRHQVGFFFRRGFFFGARSGSPFRLGVLEAHWDAFRCIISPRLPAYAARICRFEVNGMDVVYPV
jgi:hypothetical protein